MAELPENDRIAGPFIAYEGQTDFPADFPLIKGEGLRFRIERAGVSTVLSGPAVRAIDAVHDGFTCRLAVAAQAGDRCWLYSELPPARMRKHVPNGAIRSPTLEGDAEEFQAQLQESRRDIGRTLRAPAGETPPDLPTEALRRSRLPVFDAAGAVSVMTGAEEVVALDAASRPYTLPITRLLTEIGTDLFDDGAWLPSDDPLSNDDGVWG